MIHRASSARAAGSPRFTGTAVALFAVLLVAACGAPAPPTTTPAPDPSVTGVSPSIAQPGDEVTIQGTGFSDDQVITFDGIAVTVLDRTASGALVRVPETYGYPTIRVADAEAERLLFVGVDYDGPPTLADVQGALDAIAEGVALRLGADTYTGTLLVVDNRSLFGAGSATVLDASNTVRVVAHGGTTSVVADLAIEADLVVLGRGRLSTASVASSAGAGAIVIDDVSIDASGISMAEGAYLDVTLRGVTANLDGLSLFGPGSSVTVVGSDLSADAMVLATLTTLTIDASTLTSRTGSTTLQATGAASIDASTISSAGSVVVQGGGITITETPLTTSGTLVLQSEAGLVTIAASTISSTNSFVVQGAAGITVTGTPFTSAASMSLQSAAGDLVVSGSDLSATALSVSTTHGSITLREVDASTLTSGLVIQGQGPVRVADTTLTSAADMFLTSSAAGELVVEGATVTGATSVTMRGSATPFAGANGTVRLERNASISAGSSLLINGGASDVVVTDNGPIVADVVFILSEAAHVTLRANERIESGGNVIVQATGAGGRLGAVDNRFVADDGAGTILLETPAGELTQSGNVFEGTTSFPNNE